MNKRFYLSIILTFSFTSLAFAARESHMSLKGFELLKCNSEKKCVKVNANSAQSGHLSPLIVLNNVKIEITTRDQKMTTKTGELAYYSASDEKVVLTQDDGVDFELNLKDLSEKIFN